MNVKFNVNKKEEYSLKYLSNPQMKSILLLLSYVRLGQKNKLSEAASELMSAYDESETTKVGLEKLIESCKFNVVEDDFDSKRYGKKLKQPCIELFNEDVVFNSSDIKVKLKYDEENDVYSFTKLNKYHVDALALLLCKVRLGIKNELSQSCFELISSLENCIDLDEIESSNEIKILEFKEDSKRCGKYLLEPCIELS